jgi:hypothetical protein
MTLMRSYKNHKICFVAFLLLLTSGCSDPDKTHRVAGGGRPRPGSHRTYRADFPHYARQKLLHSAARACSSE